MCLGIPYEVVAVEGEFAMVRVGSGTRQVFIGLVENVKQGDWVVVHAGVAIEKITVEEAQENLRLIDILLRGAEDEGGDG